jgi:hypothetical protein
VIQHCREQAFRQASARRERTAGQAAMSNDALDDNLAVNPMIRSVFALALR